MNAGSSEDPADQDSGVQQHCVQKTRYWLRVILPRVSGGSGLSSSGLAHQTPAVPDPEGLCTEYVSLYLCIGVFLARREQEYRLAE